MSQTYIALLRGINVGGRNSLPMKQLRTLFQKAGCDEVATYIQSGNVVFTAASRPGPAIADDVRAAIHADASLDVPLVVRTADELRAVAARNPFIDRDDRSLHVMFLADEPDTDLVDALDPERSPGDVFTVLGKEIYMHCPKGLARTKLTNAYFDRSLETTSTCRNWRTVNKLLEMANG